MKNEELEEEIVPQINIKDIVLQCCILSLFIIALIHVFPIIPTIYPEKGLQVYNVEVPNNHNGKTTVSYVSIDYNKQPNELPIKKIEAENQQEDRTDIFQTTEPISLVLYFEEELDIEKIIIDHTTYSVEPISLKTYRININTIEKSGIKEFHIEKIITAKKVYSVHYQYNVWIEPNKPPNKTTHTVQTITNKDIKITPTTNIYRS